MPELQKSRMPGTVYPNVTPLSGVLQIGASGAIAAQNGQRDSGVTFTRNAAGDYRATIHRGYKRFIGGVANVIQPNAATAKVLTTGKEANIQGVSAANALGTSPISTFAIATTRQDTGALADPASGDFISWTVWVADG